MILIDFVSIEQQFRKKVKHQDTHLTHFNDLPNEIILMICRYLSPAHVVEAFSNYDKRMFTCISEYHQKMDLTKCSYSDLKFFLMLFTKNYLQPSTLTVSNVRIPTQIRMFLSMGISSIKFNPDNVRHLSLLECMEENFYSFNYCIEKFKSLKSLHIVQSVSNKNESSINYSTIKKLRDLISNNSFNMLTELELTINNGIILDKQLCPNEHLKQLTISLQNVNDLFVLLDGFVPNLIVLNVTLCQSHGNKRLSLPRSWPNESMSQLIEFQLITNENIAFTFDQLRDIVKPLSQLDKFTLYIGKWISNDQQFIDGNQFEMLIHQFMPQLHHFHCSIKTMSDIDMQTFARLNERWPMKCHSQSDNWCKHLYTVPWQFKQLHTSMLANDDTNSICPNVQYLTVDVPCTNLCYRFPNIHTLTIQPECNLSQENYVGFLRLRHLTMNNINIVPSSVIQHIHKMTLFETNELLTHPIIYSNVQHLILKNSQIDLLATVTALVQHFPNLHSLEIQLESNAEYYDNLDILLNDEHLPNLLLLKTNLMDNERYCLDINLWIAAKTSLKWRSTPFYAYYHQNQLIIYL